MQSNTPMGGASMPGALASTAIGGYNVPPYQGASRFGDAIAGGRGAGHKMGYSDATQQVLSIPVFVRPWRTGWHRNYTEGTILFNAPNGTGYSSGSPLETLLSVPLLNYMLDISANPLSADDPDALGDSKGRAFLSGASIEEVLANFNYLGIVRNELATDGKPVYDPYGPTHQRLLNVDVGGYSKLPNIFEPSVSRGDTLWLVFRQATTRHAEEGRPVVRPDGTIAAHVRGVRPLQVEGVATRTGMPAPFSTPTSRVVATPLLDGGADVASPMEWDAPASDASIEEGNYTQRAHAVRLGIVKDVCRTVSTDSIHRAMREHDAWSRQPRLGVLLGV